MIDNSSKEDLEAVKSDVIDAKNRYGLINASVEERNRKLLEVFDRIYGETANLCDDMESRLNFASNVSIDSDALNEQFDKYKVIFMIIEWKLLNCEILALKFAKHLSLTSNAVIM